MPLNDLIQHILETGQISRSLERQLVGLVQTTDLSETEAAVIDQLLDALTSGTIQPIA